MAAGRHVVVSAGKGVSVAWEQPNDLFRWTRKTKSKHSRVFAMSKSRAGGVLERRRLVTGVARAAAKTEVVMCARQREFLSRATIMHAMTLKE